MAEEPAHTEKRIATIPVRSSFFHEMAYCVLLHVFDQPILYNVANPRAVSRNFSTSSAGASTTHPSP